MTPALDIHRLTGGYSRRKPVLHGVTFDVKPGELVGLIGLNGAGKSTTIKHILGLMLPHEGEVRISGVRLEDDREKYRSSCAYVPEQPSLFPHLTVAEHLRWTAMAYRLEPNEADRRIERLAATFRMDKAMDALPDTLSKGMKQKVMLMNALLAAPSLLIIDEPFLGLDPLATRALVGALDEAKSNGSAILLSSHILPALERRADRLVVLHQGRIIATGTPEAVKAAGGADTLDDAFEKLVLAAEEGGKPGE
ncbi:MULTISPECIES: ABC transporter ATP-binding protein [Cohnella]|jgi:ABC-2 type transport system ATP-binding protein|uniref:ABC transporter ATP-binding protein n=1 Tax=Cohnella TaxID=329857 RepID=UPI000E3A1AAE|nr:ABC transporter ATP-binding protein [Cohnella sp.]REK64825.1 MAG: ABC transporter ATP-binding protein [Cohnella sp.]